ncbi:MAG: ABC transporter ATP-binding protein, partial [Anaerolineae bacterium]
PSPAVAGAAPLVSVEGVSFSYDGHEALRNVSLALRPGEVVALMGRNGSGKSTLLKLLAGLSKPARGSVSLALAGRQLDTRSASLDEIVRVVGYVPQNPGALLFKDTVLEELAFTRQGHKLPPDPAADRALLARLGLAEQAERYPRDLSSGQRQRVALAAILVAEPQVLLLDEPTRGLDYQQKEALTAILLDLRRQGRAVLLATHDVELVARSADRVVLLGEGAVVVDGPIRQVMTGSLVFASQVNKLYRDPRYLVVEDAVA